VQKAAVCLTFNRFKFAYSGSRLVTRTGLCHRTGFKSWPDVTGPGPRRMTGWDQTARRPRRVDDDDGATAIGDGATERRRHDGATARLDSDGATARRRPATARRRRDGRNLGGLTRAEGTDCCGPGGRPDAGRGGWPYARCQWPVPVQQPCSRLAAWPCRSAPSP
jgi:hypothetical protein